MPDLSILNTLIAMVIVILVLSLIVQSIQTLIKKFFKLKSRTILNSLLDLFQTITQSPDGDTAAADPGKARQLVQDVTDKLRQMGRETLRGKPMLDSLAKGDLLKVLTLVEAENLLPGVVGKFGRVLETVRTLTGELQAIDAALLKGDASAKFASMQTSLLPIIDDIETLVRDGSINPNVVFGDLNKLRQIKTTDVLDLLGEVQKKVEDDLKAALARNASDAETDALSGVSDGLNRIAEQIAALGQAFDAALVPLRQRLEQAEVWYDTVMQGFEERYTRHMRTVALIVSVVVVVLLNANFFSVYRAIAADPAKSKALAERSQEFVNTAKRMTEAENAPASGQPAGDAAATPTPTPSTSTPISTEDQEKIKKEMKEESENLSELVGTYKSFGIAPLTWEQFRDGITFKTPAGTVFETIVGWIIMVILLSAGAPFWQDVLESLFGLKNLLRQKSDTKNVEDEKGGQPKP
ncbi:MAG TPA: hypothetical protein VF297_14890 [Pyrinomonadaceae bacterium]